jgi:hypothetical protein
MYGTQPYASERMQSSNSQLGTPSGGHPDVTNAVGARRNPLVDIGFDPAETDQQLLPSPPMPSRDKRLNHAPLSDNSVRLNILVKI